MKTGNKPSKSSVNRPRGGKARGPGLHTRRVYCGETGRVIGVRARDPVGALFAAGKLADNAGAAMRMKRAAEVFAALFHLAGLEGHQCSSFEPRSRGSGDGVTAEMVSARIAVGSMLDKVRGPGTLAGSVLWHVVGMGESLNEWAKKAPIPSRGPKCRHEAATYILVSALQTLAGPGRKRC